MAIPLRYDDLGTVNAVKLSEKIDSYENYIQLYTELDSHIEEGDRVFLTYSGDTSNVDYDVLLDNYIYSIYSDDFIYDKYANGYKVIYVDKNLNTFVINRPIYTILPNSKLYGYYVSKVVCNNINVTKANIDGVFFKKSVLGNSSSTQLNYINITQCVSLGGDIFNSYVNDKYDTGYVSLLIKYDSINDINTKYYNLNNNDFGYSYFYNFTDSVRECIINSGNYINCSVYSLISGNTITGGYFDSCLIDNHIINDGYFYNVKLNESNVIWNYGRWDGTTGYKNSGNTFKLKNWKDGVFINGVFGDGNDNIWQNGDFMNGYWRGKLWIDGNFYGGIFEGTGKTIQETNQNTGSEWLNGKFSGGVIQPNGYNSIYFKDGIILSGEINNISMNAGKIYGGDFYNVSIKNTEIQGGNFNVNKSFNINNYFSNNKIYDGNFNGIWNEPYFESSGYTTIKSTSYGVNSFSDSTIYNGVFKYCEFYNNNVINNGNFTDSSIFSPIEINDGTFISGEKKLSYNKNIVSIRGAISDRYLSFSSNGTVDEISIIISGISFEPFNQWIEYLHHATYNPGNPYWEPEGFGIFVYYKTKIQVNMENDVYQSVIEHGQLEIFNSPESKLNGIKYIISTGITTGTITRTFYISNNSGGMSEYPYNTYSDPWDLTPTPYIPVNNPNQSANLESMNCKIVTRIGNYDLVSEPIDKVFCNITGDKYNNIVLNINNNLRPLSSSTSVNITGSLNTSPGDITFVKLTAVTGRYSDSIDYKNLYSIKFSNTNKYFTYPVWSFSNPIYLSENTDYSTWFYIEPVSTLVNSSVIESSKYSLSKASIRSKTLTDVITGVPLQLVYLEFENGHNFNMYNNGEFDDIDTEVELCGFKSQELWNKTVRIIQKNKYKDPSEIDSSGESSSVKPIGDNYIILELDYKDWYFNDSGIVKKSVTKSTSLVKKDKYDIIEYNYYYNISSNTYVDVLGYYNSGGYLAFTCSLTNESKLKVGNTIYNKVINQPLDDITAKITQIITGTSYLSAVTNDWYMQQPGSVTLKISRTNKKIYILGLSITLNSDKIDNVGGYVKILSDYDPYTASTILTSYNILNKELVNDKVVINTTIPYVNTFTYNVSKPSYALLDTPIVINDGTFKNCEIHNKVIVNNGTFTNSNMTNGIVWNNGTFDIGNFKSDSKINENVWYNGKFYNGTFGNNLSGLKSTATISFWGASSSYVKNCIINDQNIGPRIFTGNTTSIVPYEIIKIMPVFYNKNTGLYNYEKDIVAPWSGVMVGAPWWMAESYFNVDKIEYYLPYLFSFKIQCSGTIDFNIMCNYLDQVKKSPNLYSVNLIDPNSLQNNNEKEPFKTFKTLFDMDYDFKDYKKTTNNCIYIIFQFNTIKSIWDNATTDELIYFKFNFSAPWSLSNCGYFTHPMPVLGKDPGDGLMPGLYMTGKGPINQISDPKYYTQNWNNSDSIILDKTKNYLGTDLVAKNPYYDNTYGTEDLKLVGKMSIKYERTGESIPFFYKNSKWIYGTIPPPWWVDTSGVYRIDMVKNKTTNQTELLPDIWVYIYNKPAASQYIDTEILRSDYTDFGYSITNEPHLSPIKFDDTVTFGTDCGTLSNNTYQINGISFDINGNVSAININASIGLVTDAIWGSWVAGGFTSYQFKTNKAKMTFNTNLPRINWDTALIEKDGNYYDDTYYDTVLEIGTKTDILPIVEYDNSSTPLNSYYLGVGPGANFNDSVYNNGNPTTQWSWMTAGASNNPDGLNSNEGNKINMFGGLCYAYNQINMDLFSYINNYNLNTISMSNKWIPGYTNINFLSYNPYDVLFSTTQTWLPPSTPGSIQRTLPGWMFKWQGVYFNTDYQDYSGFAPSSYNSNRGPIICKPELIGYYVNQRNEKCFVSYSNSPLLQQIKTGDFITMDDFSTASFPNNAVVQFNNKTLEVHGISKSLSWNGMNAFGGRYFYHISISNSLYGWQTNTETFSAQTIYFTNAVKSTVSKGFTKNFQDSVVFNSYFKWKNGTSSSHNKYSYIYSENPIWSLLTTMYNTNKILDSENLENYYKDFLKMSEKFKYWNSNYQTSMQNFRKQIGIQIYTKNVLISKNSFIDRFNGGIFYNGVFEGQWNKTLSINSVFTGGVWNGWNSLFDNFDSPNTTYFIEKDNYEINYSLLKKQKLYYEIAPWDEANKKKTETVNKPLRKEDRSF